ncbi:MAG: flotillin domain-containing protein [Mariprofundales bacterium]
MDTMMAIGAFIGVVLALLFVIGMVFTRLYQRASKEVAFVRTGMGGQKVILNGGTLVFPIVHEVIPVNMNTLRLEVRRANEQALITRDRMRIDVAVEFYVRVKPTEESIADAAQTLGRKTMDPEVLKELVEGKFVDVLRSVAAEMSMEELHEKRADFVQSVHQAVSEDLLKNGLELETVSLTGLDQTKLEYLNEQNAFDAQGMTSLTRLIEAKRKERNDIKQDTEVEIKRKNLEASQFSLKLDRDKEYAEMEQERELATRKASQDSEIAREQAEKRQAAEQAEIAAKQQVEQSSIAANLEVEKARINKEQLVRESDILKEKAVAIAGQNRDIAIAEKSKAKSEAQAQADLARAKAVQAEEQVVTAREVEQAERLKRVQLVEAAQEAERDAISVTTAANAEDNASQDKAAAISKMSQAEAERVRIIARADADAELMRVEAQKQRYEVEAEGKRRVNEAANILSEEQIAMQIRLALLEHLPSIIAESVKPMQQIDSIRIVQASGLTGSGSTATDATSGTNTDNMTDNVVNSALRYRAQAPLLDGLLQELGMSGDSLQGLTQAIGKKSQQVNVDAGDAKA